MLDHSEPPVRRKADASDVWTVLCPIAGAGQIDEALGSIDRLPTCFPLSPSPPNLLGRGEGAWWRRKDWTRRALPD